SARRRYVIDGHRRPRPDSEVFSLQQAARYCKVSSTTIKRLVASGVLHRDQVAPWAPWEIKRADLESEVIRQALAHLQSTGKLPVRGNDSATQQRLWSRTSGLRIRFRNCAQVPWVMSTNRPSALAPRLPGRCLPAGPAAAHRSALPRSAPPLP